MGNTHRLYNKKNMKKVPLETFYKMDAEGLLGDAGKEIQ
jgi:hypothetical protein